MVAGWWQTLRKYERKRIGFRVWNWWLSKGKGAPGSMFRRVDAMRFIRPAAKGRNRACFIACTDDDDSDVEAFVKFEQRCENGCNALIREALSAFFAIDLGLPTPQPLLVEVGSDFIDALIDNELRDQLRAGSRFGYGTVALPDGYNIIAPAKALRNEELQVAAEILAFDAAAMNPDRKAENPNLMDGPGGLAVIDHDLCFVIDDLVRALGMFPWRDGQMHNYCGPGKHIFWPFLNGSSVDLSEFKGRIEGMSATRFDDYAACIPIEWRRNQDDVTDGIVNYMKQLHSNVDGFVEEVLRALR